MAIALNIIMKQVQDGVALGVNTNNSTKLTYGYNNVFATYNRKNSLLTINQRENYQNYFEQTSDDMREYLLPNDNWHTVRFQSLDARTLSATHGTTMKYNLTKPNNFVFQAQGYLNLQRNPKHNRSYIISETGKADYINRTNTRDQYESPTLSMYFKKYLPHQQALIFNVVGTYIHSDYDYFYEQDNNSFPTTYSIGGKKASVIGEAKYYKRFKWGSLTSGIRSFYGNTRNHYVGDIGNEAKMVNSNTYNTPRFSDRHTDGGMKKKRYLCGKEENQNGKTIEIHSSIQGQGGRGSTQGNRTAGVAGQKTWRGTLENHGMEERAA